VNNWNNCENYYGPDLAQAFPEKFKLESDFKAPNLPLALRLKVSGCHYNSIYNNT
jgi:dissimilatory sulfite reductase (desulfoviridin) alpha/beta subunit